MSYQVLARKWRPATFDQMVGQEHVMKALVNALDSGRLHHAYLFTGTRGVGKTSIARLFAKSLNCEKGVGSTPCGECSPCREISEGRFVDLIEVDAASRTKVEDTRELLENVQYAPSQGRFKVYLIDEVHMLSTHSFNALLKTLEEPPPHIKFLLATTDPQKLPVTILSRCLQFNLKNMTPERIVSHLQTVLSAEQVKHEDTALWLLARAANGSMRDALSLTDQSISYGSGQLLESDVRAMLGSVDQQQVLNLLRMLAAGSAQEVIDTVASIAEYGASFEDVLAELLGLLHRVAIAQALPDSVDNSLGDRDEVLALARSLKAEDVQLFYQIALNGRKDLPLVPVAKDGFEMTLLRMLAFRPVMPGEVAIADVASEGAVQSEVSVAVISPPAALIVPAVVPAPSVAETIAEAPQVVEKAADNVPLTAPVVNEAVNAAPIAESEATASPSAYDDAPPWGASGGNLGSDDAQVDGAPALPPQTAEPEPSPPKKAEPPAAATVEEQGERAEAEQISAPSSLDQLNADSWIAVLDVIGLSGMTYNIAANAMVDSVDSSGQVVQVQYLLSGRQMHLFNGTHQQRIEDALSDYFKAEVKILFVEGEPTAETPAQHRHRRNKERMAEAVAALQGDANVQAMVERFGGVLDIGSVKPVELT